MYMHMHPLEELYVVLKCCCFYIPNKKKEIKKNKTGNV